MKRITFTLLLGMAISLILNGCATHTAQTYDLVILGGRVIDPETGLDAIRHVGVNAGRIEAVSLTPLRGKQQINAVGLVVSPGFIDLHDHAQNIAGQTYHVLDGVTAGLELEAGLSPFPKHQFDTQPPEKNFDERKGKSLIHYGYSAGYLGSRLLVKKGDQQKNVRETANTEELKKILILVERDLDNGAIGIGFPLDYASPAVNEVELEALFRLAARRNVPLFTHIRMADDALDPSGFEELIEMTRKTGASLHMVHITSTGLGRTALYIEMMEKARAEGLDITTELYPYTAGSTGINATLFDEGWQTKFGVSYQDVEWPPTGERFTGKKMWDEYREKYPQGGVIIHMIKEQWLEAALRHPDIMIASDSGVSGLDIRSHPRGMGTYARVLGRYVREKKILSLPEAIKKMTYLPAKRLENFTPMMKQKGRLQVGMDADITIFDPDTVIDRATFAEPNQFSMGIKYVLVDGQVVVKDEIFQEGVFPGKPISANARSN